MSNRDFDIVLWGATGFTGELVAEQLAAEPGLKWAIGGRSAEKLEAVKQRLADQGLPADVSIIVADSLDAASLDAMTSRTRVVASTVGPFAKYGAPLVASCVEHGTHYCDITGEPQFIRAMIDAHHDEAESKGVRIVHCCGFDSIPSDLGTFLVQERLRELTGEVSRNVTTHVRSMKGAASGGTIASIAHVIEEARKDPEIRKIAGSPYSLNPPDRRKGPRVDMQLGVRRDDGRWTAPFLMAGVNIKIVQRSDALLHPEADFLDYTEVSAFGRGWKGLQQATGTAAMMGAIGIGLGVPPLRDLLQKRVLPKPGEGPNKAEREAGGFTFVISGSAKGRTVECKVIGRLDPGYGLTAKMLAQSALCLAQDDLKRSGVLTPSTAMGNALVERLRAENMSFDVTG